MDKDFEIGKGGNSIEVTNNGMSYDLHNSYDFEGIFIDASRCLEIRFTPNPKYGVGLNSIALIFKKINFLEISDSFGTKEILGLDEMGYKPEGDNDDEWLVSPEFANKSMHFFIRLIPKDEYIRVHANEVFLVEKKTVLKSI